MSDYRDPNDPLMRNTAYEPAAGRTGTVWGWIAAAVFLVIILGIVFGVGHEPNRFASNEAVPPPLTHPSPGPGSRRGRLAHAAHFSNAGSIGTR